MKELTPEESRKIFQKQVRRLNIMVLNQEYTFKAVLGEVEFDYPERIMDALFRTRQTRVKDLRRIEKENE